MPDEPDKEIDNPEEGNEPESSAPPAEPQSPSERRKQIRVKERLDEADEVSALLTEAFGAEAAAEIEKERTTEELPAFRHSPDAEVFAPRLRRRAPSLYVRVYNRLQDALEPAGLNVETILVVMMTAITLWAFSFPPVLIAGCMGVMMILAVLRVRPLNLLALAGFFLLTWELVDILRQWNRISGIVERLF